MKKRALFDEAAGKRAFLRVFEGFIAKIPAKEWASTPGFVQTDARFGRRREEMIARPSALEDEPGHVPFVR